MNYTSTTSVTINAPKEKVWEGLTKPEMVKEYLFGTDMDTTWEIGSPIFFRGAWEGKTYEDKGEVLSFEPMHTFSYTYLSSMSGTEDTPSNYQTLVFTLTESEGGTVVTVDQSNSPTQEASDHSASNWATVLKGMKKLIEGKEYLHKA